MQEKTLEWKDKLKEMYFEDSSMHAEYEAFIESLLEKAREEGRKEGHAKGYAEGSNAWIKSDDKTVIRAQYKEELLLKLSVFKLCDQTCITWARTGEECNCTAKGFTECLSELKKIINHA